MHIHVVLQIYVHNGSMYTHVPSADSRTHPCLHTIFTYVYRNSRNHKCPTHRNSHVHTYKFLYAHPCLHTHIRLPLFVLSETKYTLCCKIRGSTPIN